MKQRYRLFQRSGGVFYTVDNVTGKRASLKTKDQDEAQRLLHAKNEAERQPAINLQIARAYLLASDSSIAARTCLVRCERALYAEHQQLSDGRRKLSSSFRLPARCCAEHQEARAHAGEHDGNLIGGWAGMVAPGSRLLHHYSVHWYASLDE